MWLRLEARLWSLLEQQKPNLRKKMTETERNLDLLLGDALAENERLKYEIKRQEIVIAQLLLAMHEGGTLRVRDDAS